MCVALAPGMQKTNVFVAAAWMVGITIALFFAPLINGLVGGAVGGYKAGTWQRALGAAVIPAAVVAVLLWLVMLGFDRPMLGAMAGVTAGVVILLVDVGMFVGALIGGVYAEHRRRRQPLAG